MTHESSENIRFWLQLITTVLSTLITGGLIFLLTLLFSMKSDIETLKSQMHYLQSKNADNKYDNNINRSEIIFEHYRH